MFWVYFSLLITCASCSIFRLRIEEGTRQGSSFLIQQFLFYRSAVIHLKSFGFQGAPYSNCTVILRGCLSPQFFFFLFCVIEFKWLVKPDKSQNWEPSQTPPPLPVGFSLEVCACSNYAFFLSSGSFETFNTGWG